MDFDRCRRILAATVMAGAALGAGAAAHADEPLFGYAYTSDILPKGKVELEQWATLREAQSRGSYHNFELRTELEYGVTNNLQVAGYLNYGHVSANANDADGLTGGPGVPSDHDPTKPYSAWRWQGVSGEVIWRVLSPYKDPIGLAFYVEPKIAPGERELELRAILHKTFLDDKLHLAANGIVEFEREVEHETDPVTHVTEEEIEKETFLEFQLGASYRIRPNWRLGLEYRARSEFEGYGLGGDKRVFTAHFVGPNIHYANKDWFLTLTAMFQLANASAPPDELVHNRVYGGDFARWDGIRLRIGRTFR